MYEGRSVFIERTSKTISQGADICPSQHPLACHDQPCKRDKIKPAQVDSLKP
jgi:hypothetical protein